MAFINGVNPPVLNDLDYVDKILNSLNAIDAHDHTANKGLQIPTGGIADGAVTAVKIPTAADVEAAKIKALTNARVIQSNSSTGRLEASSVTNTELALLSGVTSLTSPTLGVVTLTEQASTQSTPASGFGKLYSKIDNVLYYLDDLGVETAISGGGSGSASNLEALQTQNALASIGYTTPQLDNSIRANGLEIPAHVYSHSRLIENYTSGGATIKVVHNPVTINSADNDYDSIALWAAGGAGTTLAATAGSTKVGSNHFSFNKDGSAVDAYITCTLAAQTLSVGANTRVWFWVDMPSVTGLTSVGLQIMGAATTDFSRWDLTTNSAGGAIATGYNLFFIDIANTAASSTGGTVWTSSQLARYARIIIKTSSAGQTYTGIKFAGLWFSQGDIAAFGNKYLEFTGYDTSNKNDFKMASSNTTLDGIVTLSSTVAQNYTAGISAAAAAKLVRSTLSWSQAGLIGFDTTLSSGTIALEQEMRITRQLRESLSGNYGAYVDMYNPQIYKVTVVGGSTIGVSDSENHSANLLNGDSIHIFSASYLAGEAQFTLLATRAMTAGSSHSSGTTTLTVSPSGIAVGDYVVKQNLSVSASVVSATADENFVAMSYDTSPNGCQLQAGKAYINANSVYAHWLLGAASETLALKDQTGNGRSLSKVGSPNLADAFKAGKYASSGYTTSNYVRTAGATANTYDGNGELIQLSFWFYFDAVNGSVSRALAGAYGNDGTDKGWVIQNDVSTSVLKLNHHNGGGGSTTLTSGVTLSSGSWNHVVAQIQSSTTQVIWVNGVSSTTTAGAIFAAPSAQALYFGVTSSSASLDTSMGVAATNFKIADCIVYRGGSLLDQSAVNYYYNGGVPQFYGYNPVLLRNEYKVTGSSGQRISMKAKLNRSTTAVSPYILQDGMVKIG